MYNANHEMTTTAATSMISKKSTTATSLFAAAERRLVGLILAISPDKSTLGDERKVVRRS